MRRRPLRALLLALVAVPAALAFLAGARLISPGYDEIDPQTMFRWLEERRDLLVLDVREPADFARGHIEVAHPAHVSDLVRVLGPLASPRSRPVVTVCYQGNLSRLAAAVAVALGYSEVHSLRGGMDAWRAAGLPVLEASQATGSIRCSSCDEIGGG